jgi:hypothetical protein
MEAFTSVLIGLLTALAVELAKRTGFSVSNIFVFAALLAGGFWTFAEYFGPTGFTDNVFAFASEWIGSAALVYSAIHTAGQVKSKFME